MHNYDAQQHRAGQIISPLTLQTITIARMLSVGGEGALYVGLSSQAACPLQLDAQVLLTQCLLELVIMGAPQSTRSQWWGAWSVELNVNKVCKRWATIMYRTPDGFIRLQKMLGWPTPQCSAVCKAKAWAVDGHVWVEAAQNGLMATNVFNVHLPYRKEPPPLQETTSELWWLSGG